MPALGIFSKWRTKYVGLGRVILKLPSIAY
jgi:hypothetical protein